MKMILSVFGLRDFKGKEYDNYAHVSLTLDQFENVDQIISGGGKGIETLAVRYAHENGISPRVIPPNIQKFGHAAAFQRRNHEVLEASDVPVVFWDGEDSYYIELLKTIVGLKKTAYIVPILG